MTTETPYSKTDLTFIPSRVELKWQALWERKQVFKYSPDATNPSNNFVMTLPPPNVTGSLHLGHTYMCAIQDAVARFQRMLGKAVLWLPGTDHAGIATQSVVERKLAASGESRQSLGRVGFLDAVWDWTRQHQGRIKKQLDRLGCSLDWSLEFFTMEPRLNRAVNEAFVRLYEKGLVYRQEKIVNMSCALATTVADIEVESAQLEGPTWVEVPGYPQPVQFGVMVYFKYRVAPLPGDDGELFVTVGTTRVETMLGDVAIAVHPDDARHRHLHGRTALHPFVAGRKLPVVCDAVAVDSAFGTGAVKVTPFHDETDFAIAVRMRLAKEIVAASRAIDDRGHICVAGPFYGMHRYQCRSAIVDALKAEGLFVGVEPNKMVLRRCSRSGDVIEPMLRLQWFVRCSPLAEKVLAALDARRLVVLPEPFGETELRRWLDNLHDWCVSRQLWWGHRIPAFYKDGRVKVSTDPVPGWEQDEDVLDTWFSSGLLPFAALPQPPAALPDPLTDVLETGSDILFFWVARMLMLGLELTDKLPFACVLLHGTVRDKTGAKMSKSKGNVLDPLAVIDGVSKEELLAEVDRLPISAADKAQGKALRAKEFPHGIEECGADALRSGLLSYMTGEDCRGINLDVNRVVSHKHFCNKLWNLCRFYRTNAAPFFPASSFADFDAARDLAVLVAEVEGSAQTVTEQWLLSRLAAALQTAFAAYTRFAFAECVQTLFVFAKRDLCDVYVELAKPSFAKKDALAEVRARCLFLAVEGLLRFLHPMMPHITEELWSAHIASVFPDSDCGFLAFQRLGRLSVTVEQVPLVDTAVELAAVYRSFVAALGFDYAQQKLVSVGVLAEHNADVLASLGFALVRNSQPWKRGDNNGIRVFDKAGTQLFVCVDKTKVKSQEINSIRNKERRLKKLLEKHTKKSEKIRSDKVPVAVLEKAKTDKANVEKQHGLLLSVLQSLDLVG